MKFQVQRGGDSFGVSMAECLIMILLICLIAIPSISVFRWELTNNVCEAAIKITPGNSTEVIGELDDLERGVIACCVDGQWRCVAANDTVCDPLNQVECTRESGDEPPI